MLPTGAGSASVSPDSKLFEMRTRAEARFVLSHVLDRHAVVDGCGGGALGVGGGAARVVTVGALLTAPTLMFRVATLPAVFGEPASVAWKLTVRVPVEGLVEKAVLVGDRAERLVVGSRVGAAQGEVPLPELYARR